MKRDVFIQKETHSYKTRFMHEGVPGIILALRVWAHVKRDLKES